MSQGGARRYTPRRAMPVSPNKLSVQMARVLSPSRAAASAEDMSMRHQLRVPAPIPICTCSADQAPSALKDHDGTPRVSSQSPPPGSIGEAATAAAYSITPHLQPPPAPRSDGSMDRMRLRSEVHRDAAEMPPR